MSNAKSELLIDAAVGSKDLVAPLKKLGLPARSTHLDSADVAFEGRGPGGLPTLVGIELKSIADLVASIETGRLPLEQMPKMLRTYAHSWVLVEGLWRRDEQGYVAAYRGRNQWRQLSRRLSAEELEKRMLTMELSGNEPTRKPHVRYVDARRDTLRVISALYHWWTDVNQDEHKSNVGVYQPPTIFDISTFRKMAYQLPHVGIKRSREVEEFFDGDLDALAVSHEVDWRALLGDHDGREAWAAIPRRKQ